MANGEVKLTQLVKKMELLTDGGDEFKRMFVAYSCGVFLAPTAGHNVDMRIVSHIEDVEQIRNLDWCSFIVSHLCEAIRKYLTSGIIYVYGCVPVLMMAYFHRFPFRGNNEPMTLPLVQHWSIDYLKERSYEEKRLGGYGRSIMLTCYPITKPNCCVAASSSSKAPVENSIVYPIPPGVHSDQEILASSSDVS